MKTSRTNSKSVRLAMRQHILDNVTDDMENVFPTFEEARERLNSEFQRVAGYPSNIQKFPNVQDRFLDYLMGLDFGFEFTNHGIIEFLNGLGLNSDNSDNSARLYASLIYKEIVIPYSQGDCLNPAPVSPQI